MASEESLRGHVHVMHVRCSISGQTEDHQQLQDEQDDEDHEGLDGPSQHSKHAHQRIAKAEL